MKPMVFFCQPLYGYIPPLADGQQKEWLGFNLSRGLLSAVLCRANTYIDRARNDLVSEVLDMTVASHIFFADQDMTFPQHTLPSLLDAKQDVVSGVYFGKDEFATLVAYGNLNPGDRLTDFDPDNVQQVPGIGMGCALIRTEVFRIMESTFTDRKWFSASECGEDLHFSRRCHELGIPIHLDGRVKCGHAGDKLITMKEWKMARGKI